VIVKYNKTTKIFEPVESSWAPKEIDLEKFIFQETSDGGSLLNESIFGEPFLSVSRQVYTANKKRADIVALDRRGNGVIIEIKRNWGYMGMETQALHYLADFSGYKGIDFINRYANDADKFGKRFQTFKDSDVGLEEVNRLSRVVLLAQGFDPALFSMGKWLSDCRVPFKCVEYRPFETQKERFLCFSVAYEQAPTNLFPLSFRQKTRGPEIFWHNIANNNQTWWEYLLKKGELPTGFSNQPGDEGERILKNYIKGDRILAYANSYGAVGWAMVDRPEYRLIDPESDEAKIGYHRHRLKVTWKNHTLELKNGIRRDIFEKRLDLYHPLRTSIRVDNEKGEGLIKMLNQKFPL
jgi:hypothetical protein